MGSSGGKFKGLHWMIGLVRELMSRLVPTVEYSLVGDRLPAMPSLEAKSAVYPTKMAPRSGLGVRPVLRNLLRIILGLVITRFPMLPKMALCGLFGSWNLIDANV